jgi:hypothetical protein
LMLVEHFINLFISIASKIFTITVIFDGSCPSRGLLIAAAKTNVPT